MRIVFRQEAIRDLRGIIDWYNDVAPEAVSNIISDVYRSVDQLRQYPRSGIQVPDRQFRRIVTLKYHFKISYEIDQDRILILGIFRFQNRER